MEECNKRKLKIFKNSLKLYSESQPTKKNDCPVSEQHLLVDDSCEEKTPYFSDHPNEIVAVK